MFERLLITLAQLEAGNTSENLQMRQDKSYILCIEKNQFLKSI